jgi:hypothetical protein
MPIDQAPKEIPSSELQLDARRNDLAGNADFKRTRGRLGYSVIDLMLNRDDGRPGTSAETEWQELASSITAMRSLLTKYRRDGWTDAERELLRALADKRYRITGETIPLEQTAPFTVLVINPEESFAFLRWVTACKHATTDKSGLADAPCVLWEPATGAISENIDPIMRRIVERTDRPTRNESNGDRFAHQCWTALLNAFFLRLWIPKNLNGACADNIVPHGSAYMKIQRQLRKTRVRDPNEFPYRNGGYAAITTIKHGVPLMSCAFGTAMSQSDVLALYDPRISTNLLATWQFNLPKAHRFGGEGKRYVLGFHPEAEHARWKKERPAFASVGVSHGMGAIILPNTESGADTWYPDDETHFLLSKVTEEDISNYDEDEEED